MNKFMSLVVSLIILSSGLYADNNAMIYEGQKTYLIKLKGKFGLHANKFVLLHTIEEWRDLFSNNADGFIKQFSQRYPHSKRYLESIGFQEHAEALGMFAIRYAKDSTGKPLCTCAL